jgi:aspartate dehydrogenase
MAESPPLQKGTSMRIGLIGGGTIARLVLGEVRAGKLGRFEAVALMGRPGGRTRARELAREFGVNFVESREALIAAEPQAVIEAASHQAVREHLVPLLEAGVGVVVLSAGALIDDALRASAERAAVAGVDEASIQVAKPPAAWKGIPYVEEKGFRLDGLAEPLMLFEGPAREGVPHFPQNVNIAAILSLGGIGPDRTRLKVVADPSLTLNTHTIRVAGRAGRFTMVLENVPAPDNPKTSWLACYSALAAVGALGSPVRYGT